MRAPLTEVAQGTTVYSRVGQLAEYVTFYDGKHLVRPMVPSEISYYAGSSPDNIYEEVEAAVGLGAVVEWPDVFLEPPVKVLDEECQRIVAQIEREQTRLAETREQANKAVRETRQLEFDREVEEARIIAASKRNPMISRIIDFIEGKITHLVVRHYTSLQIKTLEECYVSDDDRYNPKKFMPLLSLYGDSKGDLWYGISAYKTRSSRDEEFRPAYSAEEAQSIAEEWAIEMYKQSLETTLRNYKVETKPDAFLSLVQAARQWNVAVDPKIAAAVDTYIEQRGIAHLQSLKEAAEKAQETYQNALAGKAGAAGPPRPIRRIGDDDE